MVIKRPLTRRARAHGDLSHKGRGTHHFTVLQKSRVDYKKEGATDLLLCKKVYEVSSDLLFARKHTIIFPRTKLLGPSPPLREKEGTRDSGEDEGFCRSLHDAQGAYPSPQPSPARGEGAL